MINILLALFVGIMAISPVLACKIEFNIEKNNKPLYSVGDVIVIKVNVSLTHRNCVVGIEDTDIQTSGLEILSATKWKEVGKQSYERRFKVKVTSNKTGDIKLEAIRSCERGGDRKALTLKAKPTK